MVCVSVCARACSLTNMITAHQLVGCKGFGFLIFQFSRLLCNFWAKAEVLLCNPLWPQTQILLSQFPYNWDAQCCCNGIGCMHPQKAMSQERQVLFSQTLWDIIWCLRLDPGTEKGPWVETAGSRSSLGHGTGAEFLSSMHKAKIKTVTVMIAPKPECLMYSPGHSSVNLHTSPCEFQAPNPGTQELYPWCGNC